MKTEKWNKTQYGKNIKLLFLFLNKNWGGKKCLEVDFVYEQDQSLFVTIATIATIATSVKYWSKLGIQWSQSMMQPWECVPSLYFPMVNPTQVTSCGCCFLNASSSNLFSDCQTHLSPNSAPQGPTILMAGRFFYNNKRPQSGADFSTLFATF